MRIGERVIVTASWSSFFRHQGIVTATEPCTMVLLDGEEKPMRLDDSSLVSVDKPDPHWVAGE